MDTDNYDDFAQACVDEIKSLQDTFQQTYALTLYENWYYSQDTGLLTFSTRDRELNFSYVQVGSFSEKSNTWKWSWDNAHTLEKVKQGIDLVKELGLQSNYPKLTTGCFACDEYEAWTFTAIAAKLLNGIGVYRPVGDDQLKLFFIITGWVDNETAQAIKDKYVQCERHSHARMAFVCQHLTHGVKVGFEEAFETHEGMELEEDDDLQAWCSACEDVRLAEDEWNDQSLAFAQIKMICEKCYFEMKEYNLGYR
jgi:hypothetical protein